MNTNRNNNRRRGRGNNRGSGGGNQSNRIDNRARGNAPQMLEKYRKLAHDASLNDDRVQAEYYLQFADHYFRVIADSKSPKDEQRNRRDNDSDEDDQDDDAGRDDRNNYDRGNDNRDSSGRDNNNRNDNRDNSEHDNSGRGRDDSAHEDRPQARRGRNRRDAEDDDASAKATSQSDGKGTDQDENPFVRDAKPRKPRGRPKKKVEAVDDGRDSLSPDTLPPSIARASDDDGAEETEAGGRSGTAKPRKKSPRATGRTRSRPAEDGDAEGLEAVG